MIALLGVALALAQDPAPPAVASEVLLSDGHRLRGLVRVEADGTVVLVLEDGRTLRMSGDAIIAVYPVAPVPLPEPEDSVTGPVPAATRWWERDPNRGRYLYGPSAYPLGHLNGYVAQKEIAFTNAAIGLTDYIDVSVGTVVPTLFIDGGQVGIFAAKGSAPIGNNARVAIGGQVFVMREGGIALPFAALTLGEPSRNVTVAGGLLVPTFAGDNTQIGVATVSGVYRFGPQVAVLSENWMLFDENLPAGFFVLPSGGVRLYGRRFAVDIAAVVVDFDLGWGGSEPIIPLPWLDFTYNWSLAKEEREAPN